MIRIPLPSHLNLHTLQHPRLQILIPHIHPTESPIRSLKIKLLDSVPDLQDLIWRQRDAIRYGPLEDKCRLTWWAGMRCMCRLMIC